MEENAPQTPPNQDPLFSEHKIPVIRTYEHDIEEAIAQKKISSASISIAEADAKRRAPAPPPQKITPIESPLQFERPFAKQVPNIPEITPPVIIPPAPVPIAPPSKPPVVLSTPPVPAAIKMPVYAAPSESLPAYTVPPANSRSSNSSGSSPVLSGGVKLIIGLILIGAGIYGGYYLYTLSPLSKEPPATPAPVSESAIIIPSIVTPDVQQTIDISNLNAQEILSGIEQEETASSSENAMVGMLFEETESGLTTQVTAPEFIGKIGMNPPDSFTSSLGDAWMFGSDKDAPFVIFTTNFFQNTFAGILSWEPTLPEDLSAVFGFAINTTGVYEDRILDNKNIREYVDENGTPIFLYGFIDNSTLVIARNESTFSDIVQRIEKQTYVR